MSSGYRHISDDCTHSGHRLPVRVCQDDLEIRAHVEGDDNVERFVVLSGTHARDGKTRRTPSNNGREDGSENERPRNYYLRITGLLTDVHRHIKPAYESSVIQVADTRGMTYLSSM